MDVLLGRDQLVDTLAQLAGAGPCRAPLRTLSDGSISKFLITFSAILDDAWRRGVIAANPALRVTRLRSTRRKGAILEADELESLIEAAGDLTQRVGATDGRARCNEVRRLRDREGMTWRAITARLDIAESTAIYRYQRAEDPPPTGIADPGRRALVATLGCAGLRVSRPRTRPRRRRPRASQAPSDRRQDGRWCTSVDITDRLAEELPLPRDAARRQTDQPRVPNSDGKPARQGQHPTARACSGSSLRPTGPAAARTSSHRCSGYAAYAATHLHQSYAQRRSRHPLRASAGRAPRSQAHAVDLRAGSPECSPRGPTQRPHRWRERRRCRAI